jgi:hypothetical protein
MSNARYEPVNTTLTEVDALFAHEQVWKAFETLSREEDKLLRANMAKSFGTATVDRMNAGEYDEVPSERKRDDWNEERQCYGNDEFFAQLDMIRPAMKMAMKMHEELAMNWIVKCPKGCGKEKRATTALDVKWQEWACCFCD